MPSNVISRETITVPSMVDFKSAQELRESVEARLADGCASLALDCSHISDLSSGHEECVIRIFNICEARNVEISLLEAPAELHLMLCVMGFDTMGTDGELQQLSPNINEVLDISSLHSKYNDVFDARMEEVDGAVDRFLSSLQSAGIPKTTLYVLRTLVFEASANICLHGGQEEGGQVIFAATLEDSKITMTFRDEGIQFDPTSYRQGSDAMTAARFGVWQGYGITMMRKLADSFQYNRENDSINVLTLVKKWR